MVSAGYGAADRVRIAGDTMTGSLTATGNPPFVIPGGTSGYVLTSDGSGNITLSPATGGGGVTLTPVSKTGAYTANPSEYVACDTQTTGAFTLTLPNAPADKTICGAKMVRSEEHTSELQSPSNLV